MPDAEGVSIRAALAPDAEAMRAVEREAGDLFLDVGLPEIAADEPFDVETLTVYTLAGRAWVATVDRESGRYSPS